jgi:hypothetical protein
MTGHASTLQRYWRRMSTVTIDGAETASAIWRAWREMAGWMLLLWLLLVTSTTQGYRPLFNEIFHFDIAEKFWPIFKVSWPVAVASALCVVVVLWFWRQAGKELGARIFAASAGLMCGLPLAAAFLVFVAIPILILLGQDISPLTGRECPSGLAYRQMLQQCWLTADRDGHAYWIIDFLTGLAALYGRTNFVLAIGLGLFAAFLIRRILDNRHHAH